VNYQLMRGQTMMTYKWVGVGLLTFAIFLVVLAVFGDRNSLVYRYWARYTSSIERKLRPMFIFTPGRVVAAGQLGVIFVLIVLELTVELPYFFVWIIAAVGLPLLYIENMRRKRLAQIEAQLDGFLLALANALKAIPSVAAAFNSVVPILQSPIREEVDLATKEMKVGSTLDQSLLHMASRIGSRQVDSALSAVLIGRQVGGNLGRVLETTAASIREMARLDGVIRTKTAEGKMQMVVVGLMPAALVTMLSYSSPGFFKPLQESVAGWMVTALAGGCWVGALLWARKILAVDI
jgi:tight adherence protein B